VPGGQIAVVSLGPVKMSSRRYRWRVWLIGLPLLLLSTVLVTLGGVISGLRDYERSFFSGVGIPIGLGLPFVAMRLLQIGIGEGSGTLGRYMLCRS